MANELQVKKKGRVATKSKLYAQELARIEQQNGILTPGDVVQIARDPGNVLHKVFEWDNTKAGEQYRKMQARLLINTVKIELLGEPQEAYVNATIKVEKVPVRGYFNVEKALSDKDITRQVIEGALREIKYWQKKYQQYEKLRGIINEESLTQVAQDEGVEINL